MADAPPDPRHLSYDALLEGFNLGPEQARVAGKCYQEAPNGMLELMRRCRLYGEARGNSGAGLLFHRAGKGEHYDLELESDPEGDGIDTRRITGWRWSRGSHGETWIRDPQGRDVPPKGYAAG